MCIWCMCVCVCVCVCHYHYSISKLILSGDIHTLFFCFDFYSSLLLDCWQVMAAQALNEGILSPRSFTMAVWALLVSTLIAPFLFRFALKQRALKVHEQHVQLPD